MKILKTLRKFPESLLTAVAALVLPLLSRRAIVSMARGLGGLAYRFSRRDRQVALANLDLVFGDSLSASEKASIARQSFMRFALVMLDLFWLRRRTAERIAAWVEVDPVSYGYYRDARPCIVVTGHYGNWEVMGLVGALRGDPCTSVAMPMANPFVEWMVSRSRRVTGQGVVSRQGAIKGLLRVLRSGGRTAFVMDQNTLPAEGGRFVEFFGVPVPISQAIETLAERTGAAVLFAYCVTGEDGRYSARTMPPFFAGSQEGTDGNTTVRITRMIEEVIRKDPKQWLWMYKRWKYIPEGASRDRYPFYARDMTNKEKG